MNSSKQTAVLKFLFLFIIWSFGFAGDGHGQTLSKPEIETSVGKIAKLVEDNYVFQDKGKRIAAHFLSEYKSGKFQNAKNWTKFGEISTKILRDTSGDEHLYVRYDPQQVKELVAPPTENNNDGSGEENSFFYGAKAREKNYGFAKVEILAGNIGYLKCSEINISEKSLPVLFAAMRFVTNTKALIIDLRDNGGGGSEIGAVLESFFLPKNVALLEFRSRSGSVETSKTVAWLTEKKYDAPVFIIINKKTGSAAEAFAYSLQAKKRVVIVGQPSAGAANMNSWYAVNEFVYVSVSTGAPVLPGTEISWEGKGVQPDFSTEPEREIEYIRQRLVKK
jgi:hypothetical protein